MRRLWNSSPLSGGSRVSQNKIIDLAQEAESPAKANGGLRETFFPTIDYLAHPYYKDFAAPSDELRQSAFDRFSEEFNRLFEAEMKLSRYTEKHPDIATRTDVSPEVQDVTAGLRRDGIVGLRLSSGDRAAMIDASGDAVAAVGKRRQELDPQRRGVEAVTSTVAHMKEPDDKYEFFTDLLTRNGVFDACRQYYGFPFTLKFVMAQVNEADDRGIANTCRFPDGTRSPVYYLHIDSSIGAMKVIIYRSDEVTAEAGAFRYYPGSHSVLTATERCIRKANDKTGFDAVNKDKSRASFMALPAEVRLKANFGNDLIGDTALTKGLLDRERVCDSSGGDLLLFDSNGMHRGAVFERPEGRREILQLLLIPTLK